METTKRKVSGVGGRKNAPYFDAVVIASSAGGIEALGKVLSDLAPELPASVLIVQHRGQAKPWQLDTVLSRSAGRAVEYAETDGPLLPGHIYIAPHAHHLVINADRALEFTDHRKIRHVRPSANPLFESAAEVFGPRSIAVVLTGGDSDATDGVQSVKAAGGKVIVQDQATSQCFAMPRSAIATGCVDHILPIEEIGGAITQLVTSGRLRRRAHRSIHS